MTRQAARTGGDGAGAIYRALRRAIIEQALEPGPTYRGRQAKRANTLMQEHLDAVAGRALIPMKPHKRREVKDILAAYVDGDAAPPARTGAGGRRNFRLRLRSSSLPKRRERSPVPQVSLGPSA